ncbi:MAG: hypothetical protein Q7T80_17565 [Methanoregula sp.]|nr:hypothetical protein [Methanoregula sp.]
MTNEENFSQLKAGKIRLESEQTLKLLSRLTGQNQEIPFIHRSFIVLYRLFPTGYAKYRHSFAEKNTLRANDLDGEHFILRESNRGKRMC